MAESLAEKFRALADDDRTHEANANWLLSVAELLDQVK